MNNQSKKLTLGDHLAEWAVKGFFWIADFIEAVVGIALILGFVFFLGLIGYEVPVLAQCIAIIVGIFLIGKAIEDFYQHRQSVQSGRSHSSILHKLD